MKPRDAQRARVYAWEEEAVVPHGQAPIPFTAVQGMVDAIWVEIGLRWPPKVEPLPPQARRLQGTGSRLVLRLPDPVPAFLLFHELAHALSSSADGKTDGHGPRFVGLYLQLLTRYLRLPENELLRALEEQRVVVDRAAVPAFLADARPSS
ncbi:hypothetical protein [Roseomonas sp. WA12]